MRTVSLPTICCLAILAGLATQALAQDIFVTPIANAPFSGTIEVQRSVLEPNGKVIVWKSIREIGRDNQGRIHNESRMLLPASDTHTPQLTRIHLFDPVSRTAAFLDPRLHTYRTMVSSRPPRMEPPDMDASPSANALPQSQFVREEELGNREMDGLPVHGVRKIQTIGAESSGTGKEIEVVNEFWYSDDLRMNLVVKHSDPRTGSTSLTVTHIQRIGPDPAFFEIPQGYKPFEAGQSAVN